MCLRASWNGNVGKFTWLMVQLREVFFDFVNIAVWFAHLKLTLKVCESLGLCRPVQNVVLNRCRNACFYSDSAWKERLCLR